jgi:hypothetical protein
VLGAFVIRWKNGLGGLGGWTRIFLERFQLNTQAKKQKKICVNPPDPPNPFFHRITKAPNTKYKTLETFIPKKKFA